MNNNIHVLVIPSWYLTKEHKLRGVFFKEQAINIQKLGAKVGIIYPEVRWLSLLNFTNLRNNYFQTEEYLEDGLVTFRKHGWNIYPKFPRKQAEYWVKQGMILGEKYIKRYGVPDIIHAQSTLWGGYVAMKLSEKYRIPYIVTEHSSAYVLTDIEDWKKEAIKEIFKKSSEIFAVSSNYAKALSEYTEGKEVHVIGNSVDTEFFNMKKYVSREKFIFFTVAFLKKNKGMDILIKAFNLAFKDEDNIILRIGGDGAEREKLESLVKELKLEEKVEFLGSLNRKEVKIEMENCNVFSLASKFETFGVVLIEALSTGTPVVSTNCGGPYDIVNDKVGKLVEVDNIEELAYALKHVYVNYNNYNQNEIRQYCIDNFSNEAIGKKQLEIYNSVTKDKG
jgi:L-malate glycosyltransferase